MRRQATPATTTATSTEPALSDRAKIAHLWRRFGFGATAGELDALTPLGYEGALNVLFDLSTPDPGATRTPAPAFEPPAPPAKSDKDDKEAKREYRKAQRAQGMELVDWWVRRMIATERPLREKVAFLWHGHFATSIEKVKSATLMARQNDLFRTLGTGSFTALTTAVVADPAMLVWLDADTSKAAHPNENLARELMELFTMGHGTYDEAAVKALAVSLVGFRYKRRTDQLDALPQGYQATIASLCANDACAGFIPARLWSRLAYPVEVGDPIVAELSDAFSTRSVLDLLRAIAAHPTFLDPTSRSGLIKQPIEYVVGACRALGVPDAPADTLAALGQVPFDPPSVGGWPGNAGWLSTATSLERAGFATDLVGRGNLAVVHDAAVGDRVDAAAHLLSVDRWSDGTAAALDAQRDDPARLVALALVAPEYVLN